MMPRVINEARRATEWLFESIEAKLAGEIFYDDIGVGYLHEIYRDGVILDSAL